MTNPEPAPHPAECPHMVVLARNAEGTPVMWLKKADKPRFDRDVANGMKIKGG